MYGYLRVPQVVTMVICLSLVFRASDSCDYCGVDFTSVGIAVYFVIERFSVQYSGEVRNLCPDAV